MSDRPPVPVRRVHKRLQDAIVALAECIEAIDADERVRVNALPALHYRLANKTDGIAVQLATVIDDLGGRVNRIAREYGDDGRLTVARVGVVEATFSGKRTVWHGHAAILHRVAARAADLARFTPDGTARDEPMPYGAFAQLVADEIADVAGLTNASATFRQKALEKRGIDPAKYTDRVGESRPGATWIG